MQPRKQPRKQVMQQQKQPRKQVMQPRKQPRKKVMQQQKQQQQNSSLVTDKEVMYRNLQDEVSSVQQPIKEN